MADDYGNEDDLFEAGRAAETKLKSGKRDHELYE